MKSYLKYWKYFKISLFVNLLMRVYSNGTIAAKTKIKQNKKLQKL